MEPASRREVIHRGAKFDYARVILTRADGREMSREYIMHPGSVVIVPVLRTPGGGEAQVVFIRNRRHTVDRWLWELPAGTRGAGEAPADCAVRELEEETGYSPGRIEEIGAFYTGPGLTDEWMHVFAATELSHVGQRLEEDERIEVCPVPVSRSMAMVDSGEQADAKSIAALFLASRRGVV